MRAESAAASLCRRRFLSTAFSAALTGLCSRQLSFADQFDLPFTHASTVQQAQVPGTPQPTPRAELLNAIKSGKGIDEALNSLVKVDPSRGRGAIADALGGEWKLIGSLRADAFSPLLELPLPIRPVSVQLLGESAAKEVGAGRIAQRLDFPFGLQLELSSGATPETDNASVLKILPPFRFEVVLGSTRWTVVESGSDADFRSVNVRTKEAQAAPPNRYEQLYLETSGMAGDLRVSRIIEGDPVIVGSIFIHERM